MKEERLSYGPDLEGRGDTPMLDTVGLYLTSRTEAWPKFEWRPPSC